MTFFFNQIFEVKIILQRSPGATFVQKFQFEYK